MIKNFFHFFCELLIYPIIYGKIVNKNLKISVITPSFNQSKYLGSAIESILQQGGACYDYTIFDGGSTDSSLEIMRQYEERIQWVSEADSGPAEAINKGFARSSGDILYWLNADDIVFPETFSKIIDVFERNDDIGVVYGDAKYIDGSGNIIGTYPTEAWSWQRMQQTCIISQPAAFFRRDVFEKYGPLNMNIRIMDYDFWLRLGLNDVNFLHLPEVFAGMRCHNQAFSVSQRLELHRQSNDVTHQLLGYTPSMWLTGWACAYVEKIGIQPGTLLHVFFGKILFTIIASIRWNGTIRSDLLKDLIKNIAKAFRKRTLTPNL